MIPLRSSPLDAATLEDIRLKARKAFISSGSGAILRRKLGQSLEYREHRAYAFGDDVRHIDWRASQRHGGPRDFLVRSFEAEEQFKLLLVIDASATMKAGMGDPSRVSKLEFALWIAQGLSHIAINEKLAVAFASLGGERANEPIGFFQGRRIEEYYERFSEAVWALPTMAAGDEVSISDALTRLPQSSVTIFISDFYRSHAAKRDLEEAVILASRGYRQTVVCELNSWPEERVILKENIVSLGGVGRALARVGAFRASNSELIAADLAIEEQRKSYAETMRQGGVVHFPWDLPESTRQEAVAEHFRSRFHEFVLRSELFGRIR